MAATAPTPDLEVANLINAGVAEFTLGTNLFNSPMLPEGPGVPVASAFCFSPFGGPDPVPYMGKNEDFLDLNVQVLIRANPDDFAGGLLLARKIWSALHRATPLTSGYITILVRESAPIYLGLSNKEQPRWSINVRLWYKG